ncbi:carbohydrate ABC transporter permease [Nakamurella aerolata]|uniref:Carbohydrate ABC transporter permease n=1 Tax=Nakamurella aerolata TaxID=1656892 RepID=A0A849A235_9ACTN|nr:carbohydrate ABC transporter permease [Nakamurella aerolata]NNG34137.1 carbohydrate ABC transporter permease [Nakamurella aerolata]
MTATTTVPAAPAPSDPLRQPKAAGGGTTRRRGPGRVAASIILWGYAIVALLPLLIMVMSSLRTNMQLATDPLGLPTSPTFAAYRRAWTQGQFGAYFLNSLLVTIGAVALSTAVSTAAAYALARSNSRIMRVLEALFLSGLMLPIHLAVLPIFYLFDGVGLIDSRIGLILLYGAGGVPFSVFVLGAFFRQVPGELEEAAAIDGAGPWRVFTTIMIPLVRPALATVAVFRFVPIWNDFLFPLVLLRSDSKYTLPVGLSTFFGEHANDYSTIFAGLVITTLPLIALFAIATKQIVAGLTAGMSK